MKEGAWHILQSPILREWIDEKHLNRNKIGILRKSFPNKRPWPHLEIDHFFRKQKALLLLRTLKRRKFIKVRELRRTYDGTGDLKFATENALKECHAFFSSKEFMALMGYLTGVRLTGQVLMEGRIYKKGHRVAIHSDYGLNYKLGFILYLTTHKANEGGQLRLMTKKQSSACAKKIAPEFNKLALLAITPRSFHDVEPLMTAKARTVVCGMLGF